MTQFDPTLPVQTKRGNHVRLFNENLDAIFSLVGIEKGDNGDIVGQWDCFGKHIDGMNCMDLVNIPPIPKGLRGLELHEDGAPNREWLHMDDLIAYLDKYDLFVGPREATRNMWDTIVEGVQHDPTNEYTWTAAIKAWEQDT